MKLPDLLDRLATEDIALVSDAGTPTINDPGRELVTGAAERGINVVTLPGASAVTTALAASGLSTQGFVFLGFLPRRRTERIELLSNLRRERRTLVAFETPHRLSASLSDLLQTLGDRHIAVCREMTKLYERGLQRQRIGCDRSLRRTQGRVHPGHRGDPRTDRADPRRRGNLAARPGQESRYERTRCRSPGRRGQRQIQARPICPLAVPRRLESITPCKIARVMLPLPNHTLTETDPSN